MTPPNKMEEALWVMIGEQETLPKCKPNQDLQISYE